MTVVGFRSRWVWVQSSMLARSRGCKRVAGKGDPNSRAGGIPTVEPTVDACIAAEPSAWRVYMR